MQASIVLYSEERRMGGGSHEKWDCCLASWMEIARKWGWCTISFESCLSVQQSSGVQGRLRSSVQYVNYFYCYCIVLVRDAVVCKWKPIINLSGLLYYALRN